MTYEEFSSMSNEELNTHLKHYNDKQRLLGVENTTYSIKISDSSFVDIEKPAYGNEYLLEYFIGSDEDKVIIPDYNASDLTVHVVCNKVNIINDKNTHYFYSKNMIVEFKPDIEDVIEVNVQTSGKIKLVLIESSIGDYNAHVNATGNSSEELNVVEVHNTSSIKTQILTHNAVGAWFNYRVRKKQGVILREMISDMIKKNKCRVGYIMVKDNTPLENWQLQLLIGEDVPLEIILSTQYIQQLKNYGSMVENTLIDFIEVHLDTFGNMQYILHMICRDFDYVIQSIGSNLFSDKEFLSLLYQITDRQLLNRKFKEVKG